MACPGKGESLAGNIFVRKSHANKKGPPHRRAFLFSVRVNWRKYRQSNWRAQDRIKY